MENKVVAHYRDGRIVKGTTTDFSPMKDSFHLITLDKTAVEVLLTQLKALFFVKNFEGNRQYRERKEFDLAKVYGRKIICKFEDGEMLMGYTQGYDPKRKGFFVFPADPASNNEKIFVVSSPTLKVSAP